MAKRIAIQLFGHLRTFDLMYPYFKQHVIDANIKDGYEVDIFIHTWDQIDHNTINYRIGAKEKDPETLSEDLIEKVKELYQPKKIAIEKQIQCEEKIIIEMHQIKRSIKGCLNLSYSLFRTSQLRKTYEEEYNIKYDWTIVTRPDVLFKADFAINNILSCYNNFKLDIPPKALFYALSLFGRGKVHETQLFVNTDLIYFAKPANIDLATSLYSDFEHNIDENNFYCIEVWLAKYWIKQGLEIFPIDYRMGIEFDVVQNYERYKSIFFTKQPEKKKKDFKYYRRKTLKFFLALLPYVIVESKIRKIKKKLQQY